MDTPTTEDSRSRNGHGPEIHYASGDDLPAAPGDNPGRRRGERGPVALSGDVVTRLFGRDTRKDGADSPPTPRPRDDKGQVTNRTIVHGPALPDPETVRDSYAEALALVEKHRPLRAAVLKDMLGRIDYALRRFRAVKAEEDGRFQGRNEEYRRADEWLDNRIGKLRAERDEMAARLDSQVASRQEELARTRETASVARVAAGLPLHFKDIDHQEEEATGEVIPAHAPDSQASAAAQTAAAAAQAVAGAAAEAVAGRRGFYSLLNRARGGVKVGAVASTGTPVAPAGELTPGDARAARILARPAFPEAVPFPIEEGIAQARPEAAIAVEQGLPVRSPAAHALERQRWLAWVALVACGSIFGVSIGLLMKVLDVQIMAIRPDRMIGWAVGLALLGVAMFWVLGRVVFTIATLASEERHAHLMASHRDDPGKVGDWLRRAALVSLFLMPVVGLTLVAVEANVERFGVVKVFLDGMRNQSLASGHGDVGDGGPGTFSVLCLVLMVSLPFVLFHAAEGWVWARDRVVSQYLTGRRHKEGWEIARRCHVDRTAQAAALFEKARVAAEQEPTTAVDVGEGPASVTLQSGLSGSLGLHAHLATEADELGPTEDGQEGLPAADTGTAGTDAKLQEPPVRLVDVALAMERAREAYARTREARARRQEALAWHEERIAAYEQERQRERTEPENAGKLRLEDAYADYQGAVMEFDRIYQIEMRQVEKMMRGGTLMRLWLALMRRPANG